MQPSIPDALRGRAVGIVSLRSGLMPVGAFIAGIGSDLVGPRTMTLVLGGITGAIAVMVYLASPIIREYRLSQAIEAADAAPPPWVIQGWASAVAVLLLARQRATPLDQKS